MAKILITGANGLLGSNLATMYSDAHVVYATSRSMPKIAGCNNEILDITNLESCGLIEKLSPDLVVHCAALTNLDFIEENPDAARKVNVEGSRNIALASKNAGSYLIHVSTDAVFDGERGNYSELDEPGPINVYGKSKLEAERAVAEVNGKHVIVRTNMYGWNQQDKFSIAEWMLDKLRKGEDFPAFDDVIFSPLLVNNLGRVFLELLDKNIRGILNLGSPGGLSKLQFAQQIAEVFELDSNVIRPSKLESVLLKAKRAKNMVLDSSRAGYILDTRLLNVRDGLKEMKALEEQYLKKLKSRA
jgi:dTDP-4-dehydrorhamnose reductase